MDERDYQKLLAQLMRLEGRWLAHYCDAEGNLIVAADHDGEQASIDRQTMTVLEADVRRVTRELEDILPVVGRLDSVRQRVLIHMAFNMGVTWLLTRLRFISAVQFRFWEAAAEEMMISDWAKQEEGRATVLIQMMRTGREEPESASERMTAKPRAEGRQFE
jgi:lysozyme